MTYTIAWLWAWDIDPQTVERGFAMAQQAVLGPSCASCYGELGEHLMCVGRHVEAVELRQLGMRDQAVDELKQALIQQPDYKFAHEALVVLYADAGKEEEARTEAAKWLELSRPLIIAQIRERLQQYDPCVGWKDFVSHFSIRCSGSEFLTALERREAAKNANF